MAKLMTFLKEIKKNYIYRVSLGFFDSKQHSIKKKNC